MEPLITFNDVSRSYIKNKEKVVGIKQLNFKVFPGEIISLLGPSGCGKTTILKLISSILRPTKGRALYQSHDIIFARTNNLVGLVPQSPTLLPNRTVEENISLPLEIKRETNQEKVKKFIKLVGLSGFERFYPHQLSGGMKQRVSIARALVYQPKVLLMDEPFSSLDEIIREKLNLELINLQRQLKQTIIFVTHNVEESVFISDRILIMSSAPGRIVEEYRVDLPHNRNQALRSMPIYFQQVTKVRTILQTSYDKKN